MYGNSSPMRSTTTLPVLCAFALVAGQSTTSSGTCALVTTASSSASASGSDSGTVLNEHLCKYEARHFLEQNCTEADMYKACQHICPDPRKPDMFFQCMPGYHAAYQNYQNALRFHPQMQWELFFLIFCLLLGGVFRKIFACWKIPYTVGILIVFMLFGITAGLLEGRPQCPHHAWKHVGHGGTGVSKDAWETFKGVGFNEESFCYPFTYTGSKTFDELNSAFKLSYMLPTAVDSGKDDHQLSADELWTPGCNLLRDLMGMADIDPHLLLTAFLPGLLFESAAFGIDMGIFRKQIYQISIMAFFSMSLASILTGLLVWAMFAAYGWTIMVCWLIGVILSATDPVAVVALLKDLGASKTLGTLIEGESLLNDGSAVVLFVIVKTAIGYDHSTVPPPWMDTLERYTGNVAANVFVVFAQMFLFGGVFGYLFGFVTRISLMLVHNDRFVETSFILGMSYLCFWMGELLTGTSAVFAVVVMGLYINLHKACISAEVLHFLHSLYEIIAYMLNTVIFAIAGAKLGILLVDQMLVEIIGLFHWRIFFIYPIVLIARGLAILVVYPVLKSRKVGTRLDWKDAFVMWWGGLRGSVGLALALALFHTLYDEQMWGDGEASGDQGFKSLHCRDQPVVILLMTCVVVSATVIINGITMAPIMRFLRMTDVPDDRKFMLNGAHLLIDAKTSKYINYLRKLNWNYFEYANSQQEVLRHHPYDGVEWDFVRSHVLRMDDFESVEEPYDCAWRTVIHIERASYLAQYESGTLSEKGFYLLELLMASVEAEAAETTGKQALSKLYDRYFDKYLIAKLRKGGEHYPNLSASPDSKPFNVRKAKSFAGFRGKIKKAKPTSSSMTFLGVSKNTLGPMETGTNKPIDQGIPDGQRGTQAKTTHSDDHDGYIAKSKRRLIYDVYIAYHTALEEVRHVIHELEECDANADPVIGQHTTSAVDAPREDATHEDDTMNTGLKTRLSAKAALVEALKEVELRHVDNEMAMYKVFQDLVLDTVHASKSAKDLAHMELFKSQYALAKVLLKQREIIEQLLHEGLISDLDSAKLLDQINQKLGHIHIESIQNKYLADTRLKSSSYTAMFKKFDEAIRDEVNQAIDWIAPSRSHAEQEGTNEAAAELTVQTHRA